MLKATRVDGVYSADPERKIWMLHFIPHSFDEAIQKT